MGRRGETRGGERACGRERSLDRRQGTPSHVTGKRKERERSGQKGKHVETTGIFASFDRYITTEKREGNEK